MSNVFICECGRPIYPAKLLGGIKTPKKAKSSRENGKLGWKGKKWRVIPANDKVSDAPDSAAPNRKQSHENSQD